MTQTPHRRRRAPDFHPEPGQSVKLKSSPETGLVVESDEWWDLLLLRGVDISDQSLVEWRSNGQPVRRWERNSQLEVVPTEKPEKPAADTPTPNKVDTVDK